MGYDALPVYHEPSESPLGNPELAKDFPIVLTTGAKITYYVHSQMRDIPSLNKRMPHNLLEIHPDTARMYGVGNGDMVQIDTPRASITCEGQRYR